MPSKGRGHSSEKGRMTLKHYRKGSSSGISLRIFLFLFLLHVKCKTCFSQIGTTYAPYDYQVIDESCPRYVHLPIAYGAGLGNKQLTLLLGMLLAIDMKATFLYDPEHFSRKKDQDHESYPWVEEIFGWGRGEVMINDVLPYLDLGEEDGGKSLESTDENFQGKRIKTKKVDLHNTVWANNTRDYKDECNVFFEADDFICNYMICYYSDDPKIYERMKNILHNKISQSRLTFSAESQHQSLMFENNEAGIKIDEKNAGPSPFNIPSGLLYSGGSYNIAWHIRTSDSRLQSLHMGDRTHFESTWNLIRDLLLPLDWRLNEREREKTQKLNTPALENKLSIKIYFFAEAEGKGNHPPNGFEFLEEKIFSADHMQAEHPYYKVEVIYVTSMSTPETMVHMMSADLLVTSGSSFSFVPASVSYKPVVLFNKPKEGVWGLYTDPSYILVDGGKLVGEDSYKGGQETVYAMNRDARLTELRAFVREKYELYHYHTVPSSNWLYEH